jgi:hypothetical protein
MHHLLFANQESGLDRDVVLKLAKSLGLDEKKFTADIDSEAVADSVNRDRKQAEKLELKGTPMIYVNGRHFELEQFNLLEDLNDWIELEVEQRTGKKVTAEKIEITPFAAEPGGAAPPKASAGTAPSAAPPAPSAKKP